MSSSEEPVIEVPSRLEGFVSCGNFYSDKGDLNSKPVAEEKIADTMDTEEEVKKSFSLILSSGSAETGLSNKKVTKKSNNTLLTSERPAGNVKPDESASANLRRIFGGFSDSYEKVIGLNLINPVTTMEGLRSKLEGRKLIPFANLMKHCEHGDLNADWVIVGAVCLQTNGTAKTGSKFSVWTLSDLKFGLDTVSLFLFGDAHTRLWKHSVGTVVGVLNPTVMDSKKKKSDLTLSVNNADRVMIFGQSKDLGFCSAKRNSGGKCNSIINKYRSEYCVYHFSRLNSNNTKSYPQYGGRQSLQNKVLGKDEVFYAGQSYTATKAVGEKKKPQKTKEKDRNTLKKLFNNCDFDFESTKPTTSQNKIDFNLTRYKKIKDAELLKKLSSSGDSCKKPTDEKGNSSTKDNSIKLEKVDNSDINFSRESLMNFFEKKPTDKTRLDKRGFSNLSNDKIFIDLPMDSTKRDRSKDVSPNWKSNKVVNCNEKGKECLNKLFKNKDLNSKSSTEVDVISNHNKINLSTGKSSVKLKNTDNCEVTPKSNRKENEKTEQTSGFSRSNLFENKSVNNTPNVKTEGGLLSNLSNSKIIIDLPPPNSTRFGALAKAKALDYVKRNGPFKKSDLTKNWGQNPAKRQKVISELKDPSIKNDVEKKGNSIEDVCGNNPDKQSVLSARFIELMNQTSKHKDLIDNADEKFMEEYFSKMSKKEDMEVVMLNTFKVPCKAIRCIKCKYTWFSPSDLCKTENHPIVTVSTTKRFFSCDDCGNRTVALTILPLTGCKKCGSTSWKRAPILNLNKTVANLNDLSIRGGEQKFINSVESNTSLNLLVPD